MVITSAIHAGVFALLLQLAPNHYHIVSCDPAATPHRDSMLITRETRADGTVITHYKSRCFLT